MKEGGIIRDGFSAELDELRQAQRGGKDWLAKLQQDEIERTGITSLKVRFNSVFGYFIEVTRSNLDKVPPHYIRPRDVTVFFHSLVAGWMNDRPIPPAEAGGYFLEPPTAAAACPRSGL